MTAFHDKKFHPIKRIYLLHSPDQIKPNPEKEIIYFKNKAKKLKKTIESTSKTKVKLVQLGKRGAFDKDETIQQITKIVKDEMASEKIVTQKQIAVNITGGTNMMAVGAILAASAQSTEAYYVLDNRFAENQELDTNISEISMPSLTKKELKKPLQDILYTILKSEFRWGYTVQTRKSVQKKEIPAWKIDPSIVDTRWMKPQKIKGMIKQRDLTVEICNKYETAPNTIRNRLKELARKGMIRIIHGTPQLTLPRTTIDYKESIFRINSKENLIEISSQGKSELQDYTP
jgi:hypothetical protein